MDIYGYIYIYNKYIYKYIYIYIHICIYDNQIVHHNPYFSLFILHNSFDKQGSKIIFLSIFFSFSFFYVLTYCVLRKLSS